MFRWPIEFSALSLGSLGGPRGATLEITPRGAVFTLAALSHVGHPAHLALLDAYVKGQVRQTASTSIGEDSRLVLSSLAAPLVAAHELGIEHLTLADFILLPRPDAPDADELPAGALNPWRVRGPDSPRFLLRVPGSPHASWAWVRAAECFEPDGCLGTPRPGLGSPWHDAIVELGARPTVDPITVEVREPTSGAAFWPLLETGLTTLALARFARVGALVRRVGSEIAVMVGKATCHTIPLPPIQPADIRAEIAAFGSVGGAVSVLDNLGELGAALADSIAARQPAELAATWSGQEIAVSLTPDLDGYQTLCLLPLRPDPLVIPDPASMFETMRGAAWAAIESLMGRPLAEYRMEPIALRLIADDGRTTTLDVGVSVVIVRNQTVFTGWVGSDGRVMLKLFPAGGMAAR
jgi:hypothetical protein